MILGLFIFLAGAFFGSLFDSFFFGGKAYEHSFFSFFNSSKKQVADTQQTNNSVEQDVLKTSEQTVRPTFEAAPDINSGKTISIETVDNSNVVPATSTEETASVAAVASETKTINTVASSETTEKVASETEQIKQEAEKKPGILPLKGKLVFDKCSVVEAGSRTNYHGFVSNKGDELIFASNRDKVAGKYKYQCFVKEPQLKAKPAKLFDWPGNIWTPEFTDSGKKIVFSSDSKKVEHIFVYNRETKESFPLTTGSGKNMMPSVSPDGKLVAFVSSRKGTNDIWIVGIDGSNIIQITSGKEDDREPRWWPDGSAIIFTRIYKRLEKSHIMKLQLSPLGEPETLVGGNSRNWLADISRDGRSLAYVRSTDKGGSSNNIFIRNLETSKETEMRPLGVAEYFRPVWLKTKDALIFHANKQKKKSLYIADFKRE
jgi:Tol biopolymer transport system component